MVDGEALVEGLGRRAPVQGYGPRRVLGRVVRSLVDGEVEERISRARPALRDVADIWSLADTVRQWRRGIGGRKPLAQQVLVAVGVRRVDDLLAVRRPHGV